MAETVDIQGEKYLSRDLSSKAILNNNTKEISKYREQVKKFEEAKKMSQEIEALKENMEEIKALLLKVLLTKE